MIIINARKTNIDFTTYLIKFSETLLIFLNVRYYYRRRNEKILIF